jgi:methionyl-tRNA formyltransferase
MPAPLQKHLLANTKKTIPKPEALLETPKVRVVFMGTPPLASAILEALLAENYNIIGIVTKPDKPAGRKREISESPVKLIALEKNLPLLQPEKIDDLVIEQLRAWRPDLIIVAAYGKILPQMVLDIPGFGCINFHPSLLPKWRGAAPIQNAILSGATETGVTIMLMDRGMDTGDILRQIAVPIDPTDTTQSLTKKLTESGIKLLLETLPLWIERQITPQKQDGSLATLCQIIERADGHIIWTDDAESIYNRYRALFPWPGVYTYWKKKDDLLRLKLITLSYQKHNPQVMNPLGTVFEIGEKIGIQTTAGIIFLEEVQLEGKSSMSIHEFLRGNETFIGSSLE